VFFIPTKHLLCFFRSIARLAPTSNLWNPGLNLLVGLVNIFNIYDGQIPIVSEITQSYSGTMLDAKGFDRSLRHIEGNGHAEKVAIGEAIVLHHTKILLALNPQL
jgi:hypothetical protein